MPSPTGYWNEEEAATGHDFSYRLAKFIGQYFDKDTPVNDFGCGKGEYLRYLHDIGFKSLCGYEGVVLPGRDFSDICQQDLTDPFVVKDKGHVICLEVGEHIPAEYFESLIGNITHNVKYGCKLFLSWAIPGQAGYGHVNCQHNIYIIDKLESLGFTLLLEDTLNARAAVEERFGYFRNTIMIFKHG